MFYSNFIKQNTFHIKHTMKALPEKPASETHRETTAHLRLRTFK